MSQFLLGCLYGYEIFSMAFTTSVALVGTYCIIRGIRIQVAP